MKAKGSLSSRRVVLAAVVFALFMIFGSIAWLAREQDAPLAVTPTPMKVEGERPESPVSEQVPRTTTALSRSDDGPVASPIVSPHDVSTNQLRVHGSVVDERTGDAVPWIQVALRSGDTKVDATTDEAGKFEFASAPSGDELTADVSDLEVVISTQTRARALFDDGKPWVLNVAIGPTYQLISERETIDAAWEAKLVEFETGAEDVCGRIRVTAEGLELDPRDEPPQRPWVTMQVREGSVPWIRYPMIQHPASRRHEAQIAAWNTERHIELTGAGKSTLGIQRVILIHPQATGVVSGTIVTGVPGSRSHPIATVVLVPLGGPDARGEKPRSWHKQRVSSGDPFVFRNVTAGRWRLLAYAPNHRLETSEIMLTRAGTNVQELRLQDVPESGTWRGVFRWHRLRPPAEQLVQVQLATDQHIVQNWIGIGDASSASRDAAASEQLTSVAVRGLPVCPLRATQIACGDAPGWRPFEFDLKSHSEEVRFSPVWRDGYRSFSFRVTDASSGSALEDAYVQFGLPGSYMLGEFGRGECGITRMLPNEAPLSWIVWASGYTPARGDQKSFEGSERQRIADVRLESGWGVLLHVRADERSAVPDDLIDGYRIANSPRNKSLRTLVETLGSPPIAGVEVLVDGEHVATTDRLGDAFLTSRTMPERLTLRCEGWRLIELQHGLGGHSRPGFPEYVVWMKR